MARPRSICPSIIVDSVGPFCRSIWTGIFFHVPSAARTTRMFLSAAPPTDIHVVPRLSHTTLLTTTYDGSEVMPTIPTFVPNVCAESTVVLPAGISTTPRPQELAQTDPSHATE